MDQSNAAAAGIFAVMGVLMILGAVLGLAILAFICYLLSSCFKRIPQQHRKMEPNMVWLLMIPCFNLVWNFFVYPRLSQSFKSYFDSVNDTTVGDCGAQIGLIYAICAACCIIPYLNMLAGPATLILLIIYLVQMNGLKNKIPLSGPGVTPPAPPAVQ
jgi:hypothetical protein